MYLCQQETYSYEVTADYFIFLSSTSQVDFSLQQEEYFFPAQFSYTFSFSRLELIKNTLQFLVPSFYLAGEWEENQSELYIVLTQRKGTTDLGLEDKDVVKKGQKSIQGNIISR